MNDALNGEGPFTVFAPTDDAFDAVGADVINALLADPQGLLRQILLYHTASEELLSSNLNDGQVVFTLLPFQETLNVTINSDGVMINNAKVTVVDLPGRNGVVHVIDAVLLPSEQSVMDIIANSQNHGILTTAIIAAGLSGTLDNSDGPFTVFAPTDDAFAALGDDLINELLADPQGQLADILLYHVLPAAVASGDLVDGTTATTINGKDVNITINQDGVFINDAQVTVVDLEAGNGIVHVIDAVLLPPRITVVDIIVNSDVHNTLEAAAIAANLAETLAGDGPFTAFATPDDAFDALGADLINALLQNPGGTFTNVLLYHVVSGNALSTDLSDGQSVTTLYGEDVVVTINQDGVFINDASSYC